jgi:hypothetical protein
LAERVVEELLEIGAIHAWIEFGARPLAGGPGNAAGL